MAQSRATRFYTLPTIALLSIAALVGCSSSGGDDSAPKEETSSPAQSAETSAAGSESSSAESSASSSDSESAKASDSASASKSAESKDSKGAAAAASVPDGYQPVTAKANGISFAVPEKWTAADPEELTSNPQIKAELDKAATEAGMTPDAFEAQVKNLDLMVIDLSAVSETAGDNVSANPDAVPYQTKAPDKDMLSKAIKSSGATPENFSKLDTPLGEGSAMTYTDTVTGTEIHSSMLAVPNGKDKEYTILNVTGNTPELTQEYTDAIAQSLSKAK